MKPREEQKHESKTPPVRKQAPKPKFRLVKLEWRIAPATGLRTWMTTMTGSANHNETLVREPAKDKPKAAEVRKTGQKPRLRIVKLEGRITPGIAVNHNETLVREPAKGAPKAAGVRKQARKPQLRIVKLE